TTLFRSRIGLLEPERPLRGPRARLVGVEREDRPLGEPRQLLEVLLAERRAAGRHDIRDTRLCEPDHVGVALDDEDVAALGDGLARAVHVVEDLVLAIDRRLGGVEVLRLLARAAFRGQHPRTEADAATLQ